MKTTNGMVKLRTKKGKNDGDDFKPSKIERNHEHALNLLNTRNTRFELDEDSGFKFENGELIKEDAKPSGETAKAETKK